MIFSAHERLLFTLAETQRKVGVGDRMGTVHEVKQDGGEQKIRCVIGVDPDGKELIGPWINTTDHRGATREQQQFQKGQNVRISGADGDYRQATVTPWSEGDSFPQPDHAAEHGYGDSFQAGKLHTGKWMPEDDDQQQGGQGGQGGQSGSQSGGGGQGQDKNHRHEVWIAKEDNKPPKFAGKSQSINTGAAGEGGGQQQAQQPGQQKQKKELEEAVMVSTDEKDGYTARVGKGDDAVRVAAHEKGGKVRAGKDNYFVTEKDKDSYMYAKKNNWVRRKEGQNFVDVPWQIKKGEDDPVPNDDKLGNKSKKK
jgi:hypothetical protein